MTIKAGSLLLAGVLAAASGCSDPLYPHIVECSNAKATPGYPTSGCGVEQGKIVGNYEFDGRPAGLGSPQGKIRLGDWFDPAGKTSTKFLVVSVSAFWCVNCKLEAQQLPRLHTKYGASVAFFTDVAQRDDQSPTTPTDVDNWLRTYHLPTAVGTDETTFALAAFFDPNSMPLTLIIDVKTMTILRKSTGGTPSDLEATLDGLLAGGT